MGVAKLTEADGAGNLSRLAKQPRSGLAFTGWRRQRFCGKGAGEVFPAPLPRGERGCVGSAHSVNKTLGGRAVGKMCRRHSFLRVLGLQGTEPALCSLAWLSGDRWAHVGSVAKAAPCALRPLSLDNLQVLVQKPPYGLWLSLSTRS